MAQNGNGLGSTLGPIVIVYEPQSPVPQPAGALCGGKTQPGRLPCTDGLSCAPNRTTTCTGWWIFKRCETLQAIDWFCQ